MSKPQAQSKNPRGGAPATSRPGRMGSYNFIYLPNETGASRRISIPKPVVFALLMALCCLLGAVAGLGAYARNMRTLSHDYEKLKAENHSIRSEAAALVAKLQQVQSNLSRVDQFSDRVREEASQLESKSIKGKKMKDSLSLMDKSGSKAGRKAKQAAPSQGANGSPTQGKLQAGIGPLTQEEFEYSKRKGAVEANVVGAEIKVDSLEFKELFETLDDISNRSSFQAESLSGLLKELEGYRAKMASTPSIAPVQGLLTSGYGVRVSPVTGLNRMHHGLDIAAPLGSAIRAAAQGTVVRVGYADDYGKYVEVSHGYGVLSRYAHASAIHVKAGDKVTKGDRIGSVGMTGRTTGPHLHYEIEIGGRKVDPSGFIMSF